MNIKTILRVVGWVLIVIAALAAIPAIGHVIKFGLLVIELVAELGAIALAALVGIWLLRKVRA